MPSKKLAVIIKIDSAADLRKNRRLLQHVPFSAESPVSYYFITGKKLFVRLRQSITGKAGCFACLQETCSNLPALLQAIASDYLCFMRAGDYTDHEVLSGFLEQLPEPAPDIILPNHIKIFKYGRLPALESNISNDRIDRFLAVNNGKLVWNTKDEAALLPFFISSDYVILHRDYFLKTASGNTGCFYKEINQNFYKLFRYEASAAAIRSRCFFLDQKRRLLNIRQIKKALCHASEAEDYLRESYTEEAAASYLKAFFDDLLLSVQRLSLPGLIQLRLFLGRFKQQYRGSLSGMLAGCLNGRLGIKEQAKNTVRLFHKIQLRRYAGKARTFAEQYYRPKLRALQKSGKVTVIFLVSKIESWSVHYFYTALKEKSRFNVKVFLIPYGQSYSNWYTKTRDFFEKAGIETELAYNPQDNSYRNLQAEQADLIIYQQPWDLPEEYLPENTGKYALTLYIPYCFYMLDSEFNYYPWFHRFLWIYFVESPLYVDFYKKRYQARNCIGLGNPKIDGFFDLQPQPQHKRTIIYAPHHTFLKYPFAATFEWNGRDILRLAQETSHEINWILKPHPNFADALVSELVMTETEKNRYFDDWRTIGSIHDGGSYYQDFVNSSLLITDSISFLAEYLPTGKPVIHLRSKYMKLPFSLLGRQIIAAYYQAWTLNDFYKIFNEIIMVGNDPLFTKRQQAQKLIALSAEKPIGRQLYDFLLNELEEIC
jgi:hypothetical protein